MVAGTRVAVTRREEVAGFRLQAPLPSLPHRPSLYSDPHGACPPWRPHPARPSDLCPRYALSGPPGGAEATRQSRGQALAGETPSRPPKPGAKSNSIIVSPGRQGRGMEKWDFGLSGGECIFGGLSGWQGRSLSFTRCALNSALHPFS